MSIFEKAARQKLRFETTVGSITTEDLWDLNLTGQLSLDALAKSLNKQIKQDEEESFVVKKASVDATLQLKFDIVKHVIDVRLEEQEVAKNKAVKKQQREKLMGLIAQKEDQAMQEKSLDELKELLDQDED